MFTITITGASLTASISLITSKYVCVDLFSSLQVVYGFEFEAIIFICKIFISYFIILV